MRTTWSLLMILAALPSLALAQSPSNGTTNAPAPSREGQVQKTLPKADNGALTIRVEKQPSQMDISKALTTWAPPSWDEPVKQNPPRLTLGRSDSAVSGPLVDTFRLGRRAAEEPTLGRRLLGLPIINIFVPEPMPKPPREGVYFAWGERDVPWSVLCEPSRPGPQGVLLSVTR